MASQHGWFPIILEGDSQVILQMENKLLHGKPVSKVAENWKMNNSFEMLRNILQGHSEVKIHHVRRKENKLVDLVANYGVTQKQELQQQHWEDHIEDDFRRKCQRILEQDLNTPRCR